MVVEPHFTVAMVVRPHSVVVVFMVAVLVIILLAVVVVQIAVCFMVDPVAAHFRVEEFFLHLLLFFLTLPIFPTMLRLLLHLLDIVTLVLPLMVVTIVVIIVIVLQTVSSLLFSEGRYQSSQSYAMMAASPVGNERYPTWYTDSGASSHITNDLANLSLSTEYTGQDQVVVGNGAGSIHGEDVFPRQE